MNRNIKGYDPGRRRRCVNVYWRVGRHVRILHPAFGYKGKIGSISSVGAERVYVRIKLGRKPHEWAEVAYLPEHVRLT